MIIIDHRLQLFQHRWNFAASGLLWGPSSWFLFLVSTRQSLWSIAWTHRSYGVVELLEGALKLFLPTGCIFNRAISSKQQNSVDGFKIQKNQQSKQDFLSEFCFDSHHYEWKYFSWKWKWMVIIRSMCSVCHILKFLNMQRNFGYSAVRETFFPTAVLSEIVFIRSQSEHVVLIVGYAFGGLIRDPQECRT